MRNQIKIGLEIHIQLTGLKLFCSCPTESTSPTPMSFFRKLSLTSGEMGNFDPAALYEQGRSRAFTYKVTDNTCLLEADEEPPHDLNRDALERGLAVSIALNCKTVDVIEYMRKIVVDGSNTSGFQRTAILSFGGKVDTSKGPVGISTVCLEEDSARKISDDGSSVSYSLDRLGIPLLEIATDPDMTDADHAVETAEIIGNLVLFTGWSRKSPESVRQDVNFSMGYGRVEIKGVPKLSIIRECIAYETQRQASIAEIVGKLGNKWGKKLDFTDVTDMFSKSKSKILRSGIVEGSRVYASLLPGLKGYLKKGSYRLGRELADVAKLYGSGGIMHSDELPGFGVEEEIPGIISALGPGRNDAFFIVVADSDRARVMQEQMNLRLEKLFSLDLSETRYVSAEGETHYLRPLPGGERMYPETDIPLYPIDSNLLEKAAFMKPRPKEYLIREIAREYGISNQDASSIVTKGYVELLRKQSALLENPKMSVRILLQIVPEMEKKAGIEIDPEILDPLLSRMASMKAGRVTIEKAVSMFVLEKKPLQDVLMSHELMPMTEKELREIIAKLVSDGKVNAKNLIPTLKRHTDRVFDPSVALIMLNNILSKQE